jgi:hypothetical protein
MKTLIFLLLLTFSVSMEVSAQKQAIVPYVDFLKTQQTQPVDYIFQLFEKYDVVVLSERVHTDSTQYALIEQVISDPRFVKTVGNVFTELGSTNRTEWANRVLKRNYKSYSDFEKELQKLYRDIEFMPLWDAYNLWKYLNGVYAVNKNLPANQKISAFFTDVAYDWSKCTTKEQRQKDMINITTGRDSVMAYNFIREYEKILQGVDPRKKALVIFNTRHSFNDYRRPEGKVKDAAAYIFNKYPNKIANVMLNYYRCALEENDCKLVVDGKWDAAFRYLGNPSLGFSFTGSLMGDDFFDFHYSLPSQDVTYKDVYTGFIFYKPIEEMVVVQGGMPGVIDDEFMPEIKRRLQLDGRNWTDEDMKSFGKKHSRNMWEKGAIRDSIEFQVNRWLK